MSILTVGYPKSGNVWLNYLVRDLIPAAGGSFKQCITGHPVAEALRDEDLGIRDIHAADCVAIQPLGAFWKIGEAFKWPIDSVAAYAAGSSLTLTHEPFFPSCTDAYAAFSRRILILRDPRDIIVSFSRFLFRPAVRRHQPNPSADPDRWIAEHIAPMAQQWAAHCTGWLYERPSSLDVHTIYYERLCDDTVAELRRLAAYLQLQVDDTALDRIAAKNALAPMRQMQPNHVFRGGWGNWRSLLTESQSVLMEQLVGEHLRALGYPVSLRDAEGWTPHMLRER